MKIGVNVLKLDAFEKVLGASRYGGDYSIPNLLHLKVVRSDKPHAKIVRIELEEALRVKGVERIFTAKDIPGKESDWNHREGPTSAYFRSRKICGGSHRPDCGKE